MSITFGGFLRRLRRAFSFGRKGKGKRQEQTGGNNRIRRHLTVERLEDRLAPAIAYIVPNLPTPGNQAFTGSLGLDFDVTSPVTINQLGVFDDNADGLSAFTIITPLSVRLFNRATQLQVGPTVTFSSLSPGTLVGSSLFKAIALPIVLPAGFQGTIEADGFSAFDQNGNTSGAATTPGVLPFSWSTDSGGGLLSFVGGGRFGNAGQFPTNVDSGPANRYAAGTFEFRPGAFFSAGAADGVADSFRIDRNEGNGNIDVYVNSSLVFSGAITSSITFTGSGDNDSLHVDFTGGGNPIPAGGINFNAMGQTSAPGDSLNIIGGSFGTVTYNFAPDGPGGHNGSVNLGSSIINYTGLEPLTNTGTSAVSIFNLPDDGLDNLAILEDDGNLANGMVQLRSGNATFETTVFTNPTSDTQINASDDGETLTMSRLDNAYAAFVDYIGNTGNDRFVLNFASGVNIIPTVGPNQVAFVAGAGSDGITLLSGFNPTNLDYIFGAIQGMGFGPQAGTISIDGRGVTYQGVEPGQGIGDNLTPTNRSFTFDTTLTGDKVITLGDDPTANNGASRLSSNAGTPIVDFSDPTTALVLNTGGGNDTINFSALDALAPAPTTMTINGEGGNDSLTVNFALGNPTPGGGTLTFNGGPQAGTPGDSLHLVGVNANTLTNTFLPDSSGHRANLNLDGTLINYTGLEPVTIAGTVANTIINLPTGDGDNLGVLEDSPTAGQTRIRSGNGTFETTDFSTPTSSLTINTGNDGETVTISQTDITGLITVNAGTGLDTLVLNFGGGGNIIPAGSIDLNGSGNEAISILAGYAATTVTHQYDPTGTGASDGLINVDGRLVTYSGLSQTRGIFDRLLATTRVFQFASNNDVVSLGDDANPADGFNRISSVSSNPTTDFRNPTTLIQVNLDNGNDTITQTALDTLGAPTTLGIDGRDNTGSNVDTPGNDTFNITPLVSTTINIDGDDPTPPALPGDTLNVSIAGTTNPFLTAGGTPAGFAGGYTFGNRQAVNFVEIETLSPTAADLSITKTDSPDPAIPGTILTYTIVVSNAGPLGVANVNVADIFPAQLLTVTFTSIATGGATGNTASGAGNINDTVSMEAGSSITYIVTSTIDPSALGTITNTATVTPPPAPITDPNLANNSATAVTTLTPVSDLSITKVDTPDPVLAGTNLTYTITVTNSGPSTSQSVQMTDATPTSTTFVSFSAPAGWTPAAPPVGGTGFVTATNPSVLPGVYVFTLVVNVNANTPNLAVIGNPATVLSTVTFDPDSTNNIATADTTVNTAADLQVTKTDSPDPVTAGLNLTYTITVTNAGPSDAQTVSLTDPTPANTTFVSFTAPLGWTSVTPPVGGTGIVTSTRATLAAGAVAVFTFVVNVNSNTANGTVLSNNAAITSATTDPNLANNNDTETTVVVTSADISVIKTDSPDPVIAGQNITYTITLSSAGPSDAQMVVLNDATPPNTTFVSFATPLGWTAGTPAVGGTGVVSATRPTLVAGAGPQVFTLIVNVNDTTPDASTISNTASGFSGTSDPNTANNTDTETTAVINQADVSITKADSPDPVLAGENLTYTITVNNAGPNSARDLTLSDPLPLNVTFVSLSPVVGWSASTPAVGAGGTVTITNPLFAPGIAVFTLVVNVNANVPHNGSVINTATIGSTSVITIDPNLANNSDTETTQVQTEADLVVAKTGSTVVTAGENVTYTVTVTNNGPSDAQNVTVTDVLPSGATFISAVPSQGGTTQAGGVVTGNLGTIAAGASATIVITLGTDVNALTGTMLSNTATAVGTTADPDSTNNSASATTRVDVFADLSISKVGTPDPVVAGQLLTYVVTVNNLGPNPAVNVVVTDMLDANVTFVSATPSQGTASHTLGVVTAFLGNLGNIVPTNMATLTIVVMVNANVPPNTTITNQATVTSNTPDPNGRNNTTGSTNNTQTSADLSVTKTDSPDPVIAGQQITYTATVTNSGPSDAVNVQFIDVLPSAVTFVSVTPATLTHSGGVVSGTLGTIAAGTSVIVTIVVDTNVNATAPVIVSNTATVFSPATSDPDPSNNSDTETTAINTRADLSITKTDTPDPVFAGRNITYTITVTNTGPNAAQNVVLSEMVPADTRFVSFTAPAGFTSTTPPPDGTGPIMSTAPSLAASANATHIFILVVRVESDTPIGSFVANTAGVVSATFDPDTTNNSAANTTLVLTSADLQVVKTDTPDPITAGDPVTYTVTVTNAGPSDALGVLFTDVLPSNATFVSATASNAAVLTEAGGVVSGSLGDMTAAEVVTITITMMTDANALAGSVLSNTAGVISLTADPDPTNNTDTETTTVNVSADLGITKTMTPNPVNAGEQVTITLVVTNTGPNPAVGAVVMDTLPAQVTFVSATTSQGSVSHLGGVVTANLGNVPNPGTVTITILATVNANTPPGTTLNNTATVAATTPDPDPTNNTASSSSATNTIADLVVTKTDSPDPVTAGLNITYTITITNAGPSDAQNVQLTDLMPAGTSFVSAMQASGPAFTVTPGGSGFVATAATLASGATATFVLTVQTNANAANGTVVTNTAFAISSTADPIPANNSDSESTTIVTLADLSVTKDDSVNPVIAGNNLTYTIVISNAGPNAALGVVLTDIVPTGTTFVSFTAPPGWISTTPAVGGTGSVMSTLGSLASTGTATFTFVVHVNSNLANGSTVVNNAMVQSSTTDLNAANNSDSETTIVITVADLSITKVDTPDPVIAGQNITYTITVTNVGPSDSHSVTVTDVVPAHTTFAGITAISQGIAIFQAGFITASFGTIPGGSNATVSFVVTVDPLAADGSIINNTATVFASTADPDVTNNVFTATTAVINRADLSVTKGDAPDPVVAGTNLVYTLIVSNAGPNAALNTVATDTLPAGVTIISITPSQGSASSSGNVVTANFGTVPSAGTASLTIVVRVGANVAHGTVLTNTATVATSTVDPNAANNTATATTTVDTSADLVVAKTDSPDPVTAGTNLTYTITVTNNGPSDAQSAVLSDATPANTTFVSVTQTSGPAFTLTTPPVGGTGNVSGTAATLAAGAVATFVFVVNVNATTANGATLTNVVTFFSGTSDPNTANNTDTETTAVNTRADLSVVKTDSPDPVFAGANITYTITLTTAGPSDAQAVSLTDTVPTNTTFVSFAAPVGWSSATPAVGGTGTVSSTIPSLAAGAGATFTLVVRVNSNTTAGTTISNTVTVTSTTTDPVPANNTDTETTAVQVQADVAVVKTGPATAFPTGNATYTITVTNTGPSDAQSVTLTDVTPPLTAFVSFTAPAGWTSTTPPVGGSGGIVTSTTATLTAGSTAVFVLVVQINANAPDGAVTNNTAIVSSGTTDNDTTNNSSTVSLLIRAEADLGLTKTDSPDPIIAGNPLTYTITLTNAGPNTAEDVALTDVVPTNTTFVSFTAPGGWTTTTPAVGGTGTVTATNPSVPAGANLTFTLVVQVTASVLAGSVINNTVTVGSVTFDPDLANNTATAATPVEAEADLAVTKTGPATVTAGTPSEYTITVTNNGPSDAQNVELTDLTPTNTTLVFFVQTTGPTFTVTSTPAGATATIATLTPGATATFVFGIITNANAPDGSTINNTAIVDSATTDPDTTNDTATVISNVITRADLAVTKSDSPDPVIANQDLTYTITVTNIGPSDAQSVVLTDTTPANTTFVSFVQNTGPAFAIVEVAGAVTASIPTLDALATATFTMIVHVDATAGNGITLSNTAAVTTTTTDPVPANNSDTETTQVINLTISGHKFEDLNGDGIQDPGEPGRAGVTINLDIGANGSVDDTTTTDVGGHYEFTNLGPGTYRVREVVPADTVQTTTDPADIVLTNADVTDVNFGNFTLFDISGQKYDDRNADGVKAPGENGVSGVTINLDIGANGSIDATTTTGVDGNYSFLNLGPGVYRVTEVAPAGTVQSSANPPDIQGQSGTDVGDVDFGNFKRPAISFAISAVDQQIYRNVLELDTKASSQWTLVAPGKFMDLAATEYGPLRAPVVFGLGLDRIIYVAKMTPTGELITGWVAFAPGVFEQFDVGTYGAGQPIVFGVGTTSGSGNRVFVAQFDNQANLVNGFNLVAPGAFSSVAVGQFGNGGAAVFGIGRNDHQAYKARYDATGAFLGGWGLVAPGTFTSLSVGSRNNGTMQLFGIAPDSKLYGANFDNTGNLANGFFQIMSLPGGPSLFSLFTPTSMANNGLLGFGLTNDPADQRPFMAAFNSAGVLTGGFTAIDADQYNVLDATTQAGFIKVYGIKKSTHQVFVELYDELGALIDNFMPVSPGMFTKVKGAP